MLAMRSVCCPYCGEIFETNVDGSGGTQEYIEDCYVCCRPIVFHVVVDDRGGEVSVEVKRDDE